MSLPRPYYQDSAVTLYHGDCREIVPLLGRFDLLLTDPPYGIGLGYEGYDDSEENLDAIVRDCFPVMLGAAKVLALTPGIVNLHRWPKATWCLAWTWEHTGSTGRFGFNQWGPILVYGTCPFLSSGKGRIPDVVRCSSGGDMQDGHPCPKPLTAWKKILLRLSINEGDTVIDPFAGSGTTGRACKDLGRKCVMIEREEKYCEIAARRMGQEVLALEVAQ